MGLTNTFFRPRHHVLYDILISTLVRIFDINDPGSIRSVNGDHITIIKSRTDRIDIERYVILKVGRGKG